MSHLGEDGWTDIVRSAPDQTVARRLDAIESRITTIETQLREILGHCRQQTIIQRASIPFPAASVGEDANFLAARAANMALRQKVPIPFQKSKSEQ